MLRFAIYLSLLLSFLLNFVVLCGCTTVERSSESGYSKTTTEKTESGWRKTTQSEKSYLSEGNGSDQKTELKQLENGISGKRELEQYSKALPWFNNGRGKKSTSCACDLTIGARSGSSGKIFRAAPKHVIMQMQGLVDSQDIAVGMPESLVKKSWGDPAEVEVSGLPEFHNQRWRYQKYVSSPDGYKSERKTVYFEGGKVVGWETE